MSIQQKVKVNKILSYIIAGVGKLRPAGHMLPAEPIDPAHKILVNLKENLTKMVTL